MKKRTRRKKERKKWKKGFSRKRVFERERKREVTEQGRANGSGGDRPRANYASASALVLAEANLWKTRASTAVVISRRIPRGPRAGLLSHGVRGECRGEKLHRWKGLLRHLRTFTHFFFLPFFLSFPFIPFLFRVRDRKAT